MRIASRSASPRRTQITRSLSSAQPAIKSDRCSIAAKTEARSTGATASIVNVMGSALSMTTDEVIMQGSGPEICVVSTKAALAQMVILMRVALELGRRSGPIDSATYKATYQHLHAFPSLVQTTLNERSGVVRNLAERVRTLVDLPLPSALAGPAAARPLRLVDAWLAAHPDHPPIPHLEDDIPGGVDSSAAEANAAIGATDPGAVADPEASPAEASPTSTSPAAAR